MQRSNVQYFCYASFFVIYYHLFCITSCFQIAIESLSLSLTKCLCKIAQSNNKFAYNYIQLILFLVYDIFYARQRFVSDVSTWRMFKLQDDKVDCCRSSWEFIHKIFILYYIYIYIYNTIVYKANSISMKWFVNNKLLK